MLCFATTAAVIWELAEFLADRLFDVGALKSLNDTLSDMLFGMLGAYEAPVASLLQAATPESIVFTAGGTESNNLAIWGVSQQYAQPQHLIISEVEHSAISAPVEQLEAQGWQVTRLPVAIAGE